MTAHDFAVLNTILGNPAWLLIGPPVWWFAGWLGYREMHRQWKNKK